MLLFVLAYLGGVLTIVSPCILPVIPFVLARADRPFQRNGLPMLVGMALAFAVVATLASVAGGWVVSANQYGRIAALARRLYDDAALALRELHFIPKAACRAIQMADLFAFYSRRHGKQMFVAPQVRKVAIQRDPGIMLKS